MKAKPIPSKKFLESILFYCPDSGKLFWRQRPREHFSSSREWKRWNTTFALKEAGYERPDRRCHLVYRALSIKREVYSCSRIIMSILGYDQSQINSMQVDHIDGDSLNNRPENLRLVHGQQNYMNRRKRKDNTSGYTGVCYHKQSNSWQASISVNGRLRSLGYHKSPEDAAEAVKNARHLDAYTERHGL